MEFLETLVATLVGAFVGGWISFLATRYERKMALRRDIYLEAAEAIGRSQALIASFSRDDLTPSQLTDIALQNPGAINKTHIVASRETLKAIVEYGEFVTKTVVDLLSLRLRVHHVREEIRTRREEADQIEREQEYIAMASTV